jgi:hypothetical protein
VPESNKSWGSCMVAYLEMFGYTQSWPQLIAVGPTPKRLPSAIGSKELKPKRLPTDNLS